MNTSVRTCSLILAAATAPAGMTASAAVPPAVVEQTFADAFFIARRADGGLELLGSLVIWFLLALSMVGIGLIVSMAVANRRRIILPPDRVLKIRNRLRQGRPGDLVSLAQSDRSFFGRILEAGLQQASQGSEAMRRALEQAAEEETIVRFRRIELLNVLGQVSPMIGLFGTVYGMILAFGSIVASGGTADPVMLAGGIGTALTTTFWGLVVAIPALAGYALLRNRIDELTVEATAQAEQILDRLDPGAIASDQGSAS